MIQLNINILFVLSGKLTASGIVKAIERLVITVMEMPDFVSKVIALDSDDAFVMLGCNSGVFALLKEMQPAIIAVHYFVHRLELAYKDTVQTYHQQKKL